MRILTTLAALMLLAAPMLVEGGVRADDLPAETTWYFHADLEEMRSSPTGKRLYEWLDEEVFEEIRSETGVDLSKEIDRVTAYSAGGSGAAMVLDGRISQDTRDKMLAAASGAKRLETLKSGGTTYYYVMGDGEIESGNMAIDGLGKEFYFSFGVKNKLVVAARKEQMLSLLAGGGKIPGQKGHDGGFFVLTAERSLIQAGMKPEEVGEDEGGFESNILRNTRQLAVMIADVAGNIAVEAQLVAKEPEMAQSLASIVRGLIALQAFSDEMDPDLSAILKGTRVDVNDDRLKISVALTAKALAAALDDA